MGPFKRFDSLVYFWFFVILNDSDIIAVKLIPESRRVKYLFQIYYNVLYIKHPSNKFEEAAKLFEIILPKMQ